MRYAALAGLMLVSSTPAFAQAPAPLAATTWRFEGGHDTLDFRDIVRAGPPVDASPVFWRGSGTGMMVQHDRDTGPRLHQFTFAFRRVGSFVYHSPLGDRARPSSDRYQVVEGRYEYRRYFFDNVAMRGLDGGLGVQAIVEHSARRRTVPDALVADETMTSYGTAFVLAARLRRWSRWRFDLAWVNAFRLARLGETYSADAAAARTRWGGGWATELMMALDVRFAKQLSLGVTWRHTGDGTMSSHRSFTTSRDLVTAGVTYAK